MRNLFVTILGASLSAGVLTLILIALKRPLQKHVQYALRYYLWLIVLLRMLIPAGLPVAVPLISRASLFSVSEERMETPAPEPAEQTGSAQAESEQISAQSNEQPHGLELIRLILKSVTVWQLLYLYAPQLWLIGAGISLLWNILTYLVFAARLRRSFRQPSAADQALFSALNPGRVRLVISPATEAPMLMGILRPTVILPDCELKAAEKRYIYLHELTHARRNDVLYKWVALIANCVHWFNPAAYLLRREISRDCELSCDEAVIRDLDAAGRTQYGNTLLSLAGAKRISRGAVVTTLDNGKQKLKERLLSIAHFVPQKSSVLSAVVALIMLASCLPVLATRDANDRLRANTFLDQLRYIAPCAETDNWTGTYLSSEYYQNADNFLYLNGPGSEELSVIMIPHSDFTEVQYVLMTMEETEWIVTSRIETLGSVNAATPIRFPQFEPGVGTMPALLYTDKGGTYRCAAMHMSGAEPVLLITEMHSEDGTHYHPSGQDAFSEDLARFVLQNHVPYEATAYPEREAGIAFPYPLAAPKKLDASFALYPQVYVWEDGSILCARRFWFHYEKKEVLIITQERQAENEEPTNNVPSLSFMELPVDSEYANFFPDAAMFRLQADYSTFENGMTITATILAQSMEDQAEYESLLTSVTAK